MAHCDAPSFSLGLDFSLDPCSPPLSPIDPHPNHDDLQFALQQVPDSDPDTRTEPPQRVFKRLRRGPPEPHPPPPQLPPLDANDDDDEDIEEFSQDQPDEDDLVLVHPHPSSTWSSSKVSLKGSEVLTPLSSRVSKRKQPGPDDDPVSAKMETGKSGLVFPKLTTTPLRRFQLIDSDSDDDDLLDKDFCSAGVDKNGGCNRSNNAALSQQNSMKTKLGVDHDLWKDFDFSPVKRFSSVPTPAFNEMCEEYFCSAKNKEAEKSGIDVSGSCGERRAGVGSSCQQGDHQQVWDSAGPVPPSHQYFFHEDPRIQQLVRSRLCNFSPLGITRVNQQPNASQIDYMGQFGNGGASDVKGSGKSSARGNNRSRNLTVEGNASGGWVDPKGISPFSNGESSRKKPTKRNSSKNSVSRGKHKMNESNTSDVLSTSAHWVNPNSCTSTPKDAGKRRVQASDQSSGHWFTSSDGRKVYVNKSGQELTGRIAYRQYRKETGTGFKKSRKKTGAKKTTNNAKKKK